MAGKLTCCSADHSQHSQAPPFMENWLPDGMRSSFNHLMQFMFPNSVCIVLEINCHAVYVCEVIYYFYCLYLISSWDQTGNLYLKWISMFMISAMVSSVPNQEKFYRHCSSTALECAIRWVEAKYEGLKLNGTQSALHLC